MGADSDARRWLRQRGAETIQHPGGTLYSHLCRHDRLAELGCGVDVQLAGLAHAVYGTDGFDVTLLDRTGRAALRNLIGDDAEALVYLYGACDRRRTWRKLAMTGEVVDRFTDQTWHLSPGQMRPFVDLRIVNELDVIEQDPSNVDKYGGYRVPDLVELRPAAVAQLRADPPRGATSKTITPGGPAGSAVLSPSPGSPLSAILHPPRPAVPPQFLVGLCRRPVASRGVCRTAPPAGRRLLRSRHGPRRPLRWLLSSWSPCLPDAAVGLRSPLRPAAPSRPRRRPPPRRRRRHRRRSAQARTACSPSVRPLRSRTTP